MRYFNCAGCALTKCVCAAISNQFSILWKWNSHQRIGNLWNVFPYVCAPRCGQRHFPTAQKVRHITCELYWSLSRLVIHIRTNAMPTNWQLNCAFSLHLWKRFQFAGVEMRATDNRLWIHVTLCGSLGMNTRDSKRFHELNLKRQMNFLFWFSGRDQWLVRALVSIAQFVYYEDVDWTLEWKQWELGRFQNQNKRACMGRTTSIAANGSHAMVRRLRN